MRPLKRSSAPAKRAGLPYHRDNLRRLLLKTSLDILEERGPAFLSLREVARRAKVSHAAPYHYFATKQDILAALAEEGLTSLAKCMQRSLSGKHAPMERFAALGKAYIRYAVSHPSHFKVMFGAILSDRDRYPNLDKAASSAFGLLLDTVREAREASLLADLPDEELAIAAWSLVHGLSSLWMEGTLKAAGVNSAIDHLAARTSLVCQVGLLKRRV